MSRFEQIVKEAERMATEQNNGDYGFAEYDGFRVVLERTSQGASRRPYMRQRWTREGRRIAKAKVKAELDG